MIFIPQHIPGRINVIADSLSRVTPLEFQDSNAEKDILAVNFLQYSSIEERERDEMLQENQQRQRTPITKALHFLQVGQQKEARFWCPFIPTGISEMNSR